MVIGIQIPSLYAKSYPIIIGKTNHTNFSEDTLYLDSNAPSENPLGLTAGFIRIPPKRKHIGIEIYNYEYGGHSRILSLQETVGCNCSISTASFTDTVEYYERFS